MVVDETTPEVKNEVIIPRCATAVWSYEEALVEMSLEMLVAAFPFSL